MSTLPENEFDLEKLFLPAWAQEPSSAKYAKYEGVDERPDRREDHRRPRPRREGFPAGRRDQGRPRTERPGGATPTGERGPVHPRGRPSPHREDFRERREPPAPLPEVNVMLIPDEKGVESLARQIKVTGRAYPLFGIAQMILQKPERHTVTFSVKKNAEGRTVQPLLVCALDETIWLSEAEAVDHVLKKHFATFYQAERTATEPPKGKYTFVAQCGMSGVVLGPPNYHDYQNRLRRLHADRFSRIPFEVYKSRVKIVRDEEVVKKWIDDQSWRTEYVCLNLPEPLRLGNMEAVEKHFREVHKDNIIKETETHTMGGAAARALRSSGLARLVRNVWEDQRRFPLQIATVLSQQFASHGLQFFKVNKAITHVSVARPHYLDLAATPVSEGVKAIVDYINEHPKCTRRQLVEALAPSPQPPAVLPGPTEGALAPAPDPNSPTSEQTVVVADLHWLVHQGHVIEFADGILETAKRPVPKPAKPPQPKTPEKSAEPAAVTENIASGSSAPAAEATAGLAVGEPAATEAVPSGDSTSVAEKPVPTENPVVQPELPVSEEETRPAVGMPPLAIPAALPDGTPTEAAVAPVEPRS